MHRRSGGWSVLFALVTTSAAAQPPPVPEPFPQRGVLASQGNVPAVGSITVPQLPMGTDEAPVPVSASISGSSGLWEFAVSNRSGALLKATGELVQYGPDRRRITSRPWAVKLGNNASEKFSIPAHRKAAGAAVYLTGWRNVAANSAGTPSPSPSAEPSAANGSQ